MPEQIPQPLPLSAEQLAKSQTFATYYQERSRVATAVAQTVTQMDSNKHLRGKSKPPIIGYRVMRPQSLGTDSGPVYLEAGRYLDAVEHAALIGDCQRNGDIDLVPVYGDPIQPHSA